METKDHNPALEGQFDEVQASAENTIETAATEPLEAEGTDPEITVTTDLSTPTPTNEQEFEPVDFEEEIMLLADDGEEEFTDDTSLHEDEEKLSTVDYSSFSKENLIKALKDLLDNHPIEQIRRDVESIKIQFYKTHKAEVEKSRKKFIEEGGDILDFKPIEDILEPQLKELLKKYKDSKAEYNKNIEKIKEENLKEKYQIIEDIKELSNRKESINQTFQDFRELQKRWRNIGLVPQQNLKDLWETYHHNVEKFYDFIKINKELRDLDLKRNLEAKIKICERADDLLLEPSVVKAFNTLQKYHNQWREVGPVPVETKESIWERFKETTLKINKKHQEYFEQQKDSQKNNLDQKAILCEKAEEINSAEIVNYKDWDEKSKELLELQKIWKSIGFAPKKDNNKIYLRFREACDAFYNKKREYYQQNKEVQNNNLQIKTDLCIQAEALKNSTEWKKTTEDLINLQKHWKEIGPVPRKYSDVVWKRFRGACDEFFKNKSEHFSTIDIKYEENLKLKQELIEDIKNYQLTSSIEENFEKLKEFQRRWAEIGFVAMKYKDEIQKNYRDAINKMFDSLKIDESKKNLLKFRTKIENLSDRQKTNHKLDQERDKYMKKLNQLENDIVLWENNIGFFAKSKNAEIMIQEVNQKIENARNEIKVLEEKVKMIDSLDE
jgi:hypothetical protein